MKKRYSLFFCIIVVVMCFTVMSVQAVTYEPDNDGLYTIELQMESNNNYFLFVLKGTYDQTNYIEAYAAAQDDEILYFEQKISDENGKLTFGPFAPLGYYDATLIVGGTDLNEFYLAGHMSAKGISNTASISISGLGQSYTVKGVNGQDFVIDIDAELLDSFGYPSVTGEEVVLKLENNTDGVWLEGNRLTISKFAKSQTFAVKASAGTAVKTEYINVLREEPAISYIEIYTDSACKEIAETITVAGVNGKYSDVTVYAKSFDQYKGNVSDSHTYVYNGEAVDSTFSPVSGNAVLTATSTASGIKKTIVVIAVERPDYKTYALQLYELVAECEKKLKEDKKISVDGWDIPDNEIWTTQAAVDSFASEIASAKSALDKYGTIGYSDSEYYDEFVTLQNAFSAYNSSLKNGTRSDVVSITLDKQSVTLVDRGTAVVYAQTDPIIQLTTDVITWTSSDESVVTVIPSTSAYERDRVTLKGVSSGNAVVTATTRNGLVATVNVTVIKKASDITLSPSKSTVTYGGEKVVLKAQVYPNDSTDIIEWTYDKTLMDLIFREYVEGAYRVVEAEIVPKASGYGTVIAAALYGQTESYRCEVTTVMPDWEMAQAPVANVKSGSILGGTQVSLVSDTSDSTIYYTLDGTIPSRTNGRLYKNPIVVNQSLTLKAVAVADGFYDSDVATYEYKIVNTSVAVSSAIARAGEVVKVSVGIDGFDDVKSADVLIEYDPSVLSVENVQGNDGYNVVADFATAGTVKISYQAENNIDSEDSLVTIVFKVSENANENDYEIRLTKAEIVMSDENVSNAAVLNGKVSVLNYILGDADNDGKIGLSDVLIITQYTSGNENAAENILLEAADVNDDGVVDNDDAILVSKYCIGWNVAFGPQNN